MVFQSQWYLSGVSLLGGRCLLPPADNAIDPHLQANCEVDPFPLGNFKEMWNTEGGMSVDNTDVFSLVGLLPKLIPGYTHEQYILNHNFFVPNLQLSLLATNESGVPAAVDAEQIFKNIVPTVLADYLSSPLTQPRTQYNGATFGAFIHNFGLVDQNLSDSTNELLHQLDVFNNSSYFLTNILKRGIRTAVYTGKLNKIIKSVLTIMHNKLPIFLGTGTSNDGRPPFSSNSDNNRVNAYRYVKAVRKPLQAKFGGQDTNKGLAQRAKQRYWVPPTDINLRVPVATRSGTVIGVPIKDRCGLEIPTVSACWDCDRFSYPRLIRCDHAVVKNATCMPVHVTRRLVADDYNNIIQDTPGYICHVSLKSDIDKSWVLEQPHISVINGLLSTGGENNIQQYGFDLEVSSLFVDKIEESSGVNFKESYLVKLDCATVSSLQRDSADYKITQADYDLVWESGNDLSSFNTAVSAWSGPRNTVYIDMEDPWWKHFLSTGKVTATYNDLNLDGVVEGRYPRRINRDMLLVPVDKYEYNPAFGQSRLTAFARDEEIVKRQLKTFINPIPEIYNKKYTKAVLQENKRGICGEMDNFAIRYEKLFEDGYYQQNTGLLEGKTGYSILGLILSRITVLQGEYDLAYREIYDGLTHLDLFSFFSLNDITKLFMQLPKEVRIDLFEGSYNNVKIIPTITGGPESFLTDERRTGLDLSTLRNFTVVPSLNDRYFPSDVLYF